MLGFDKFVPRLHQPVKDLYFPKNPNIAIEEQHPIKFRMHLDPRKTYKTTMGLVDTAQWVAAFPKIISILNETATQPLARSLTNAVAYLFYRPKGRAATPLQLTFPECVVEKAPDGEYICPARERYFIEATLGYTSPRTSQAGWHPWIINPDDMVDTENSGLAASDTSRKAIISIYHANKNTLLRGGYINIRGTRYHPFDLYGDLLEKMDPTKWKVLIRGSMEVISGDPLLPGEFPEEEDVRLLFPELLSYDDLRTLYFENYEAFMCQQQNHPAGGSVPTFDEQLYQSILCAPERAPVFGDTYICWRLPYGGKDYMKDYAEGAAARVHAGRVYVTDAWSGIYPPSRLAQKIIREAKKHQTTDVLCEALPGTEYLEAHIRNEGYRKNHSVRLRWLEFEEDDNVRHSRITQLEPQMRAGKISILEGIGKAQELRRQFVFYGLIPQNGIMDCISRLAAKIPVSNLRAEIEEEEAELRTQRYHDQAYNMTYEHGGAQATEQSLQQTEQAAHEFAMERTNSFGLPDILGGLDG